MDDPPAPRRAGPVPAAGEMGSASDPEAWLPPGVTIRPARPSDVSSYLEMWRAVVAERRFVRTEAVHRSPRHYRKLFRESWSNDRARLVAVAGDRVIGTITIERMDHPVNRHVATMGMAVAARWRGKGVGSALLTAALKWARSAEVEKVSLEVYPGNEAAAALYRKFGFAEEGRLVRQSKKSYGYEDEVILSRFLP
jgi:RimJ/RimL family protein N-acetyltransferase